MKRIQTSLAKVENLRKAGKALFALAALLLLTCVALRHPSALLRAGAQDVALAEGGDYDLSWWTVDGGGYTFSEGGEYSLGSTIGQADARVLIDSDYTLTGGFWSGVGVPAEPEMQLIYLPLVVKNYP